jgi:hypothetical protein
MKAKSTIKKQITLLKKIADDPSRDMSTKLCAYDYWHVLRWVIENGVSWTPAGMVIEDEHRGWKGK